LTYSVNAAGTAVRTHCSYWSIAESVTRRPGHSELYIAASSPTNTKYQLYTTVLISKLISLLIITTIITRTMLRRR